MRWVKESALWLSHSRYSVFHSNPKKGNAKEYSNYRTIALISHANKVMLKIFQARLQQYVNRELPDVQAGFRKEVCLLKYQDNRSKIPIEAETPIYGHLM